MRSLRVMTLSPFERAHRDGVHRGAGEELAEVVLDLLVDLAVEVDEVHLVDGEHEVGDAEQPRDPRVPLRLRANAVARVDQQDGDVGRRGAGGHVARVLLVTRACRRG